MVSIVATEYYNIEKFDEDLNSEENGDSGNSNVNSNVVNTGTDNNGNKPLSDKISDLSKDIKTELKTYENYNYDENNPIQSLSDEYKISYLDIADKVLDGNTTEILNDSNQNKKFSNIFYICITIAAIILLIVFIILIVKFVKKLSNKKSSRKKI